MGEIIYAFSTPAQPAALQILRISGTGAGAWCDAFFAFGPLPVQGRHDPATYNTSRQVASMPGYQAAHGYLYDPESYQVIDEVVLLRYQGPASYTGEDMVEISCHGSLAVRQAVLDLCGRQGGRLAERGEFSERAFANGKLDLTQAEAVIDLIEARAERTASDAVGRLAGNLSRRYEGLQQGLYDLLAELQLAIDYPEHEDSQISAGQIAQQLQALQAEVQAILASYRQGRILNEGMRVVFLGPVNAGKSSLLNALSQTERVIVSDIPGTTRDTVELEISLEGLPVRLVDTAGLRQAADPVEQAGIERSWQEVQTADLLFYLLAPDQADELENLAAVMRQKPADTALQLVLTKADLDATLPQAVLAEIQACYPELASPLVVSVHDAASVAQVRQAILATYESLGQTQAETSRLSSAREAAILERVEQILGRLRQDQSTLPLDILAQGLMTAADTVAELSGEIASEAVLQTLFDRFCVGK